MAERAKATTDTPRRVTAKTGVRRSTRNPAGGASSSATEASKTRGRSKTSGEGSTAGGSGPGDARYEELRGVLQARLDELTSEYDQAVVALTDLQRSRVSDGAGDDQADTGTKTFEREQELSLVHGLRERVQQVEHALARLEEGAYGSCERCGNPIPTARLEAFPSVTLCVSCKQIEERR